MMEILNWHVGGLIIRNAMVVKEKHKKMGKTIR